MFELIFIAWGVGMIGYILINKANKYNNLNFYDVKNKVKKFKKVREDVIGSKKNGGLF